QRFRKVKRQRTEAEIVSHEYGTRERQHNHHDLTFKPDEAAKGKRAAVQVQPFLQQLGNVAWLHRERDQAGSEAYGILAELRLDPGLQVLEIEIKEKDLNAQGIESPELPSASEQEECGASDGPGAASWPAKLPSPRAITKEDWGGRT